VPKKSPQADLLGNFFAVMFSCDDLYLIKGSPSTRRNWLDSVIFQLGSKYHKTMQNYQKTITQKNALLKSARETGLSKKALKEQLEIWNEQIINCGSEILETRLTFLEEIRPIAKDFQKNISKQKENLGLVYKSTIYDNAISVQIDDIEIIKKLFNLKLTESFDEECARGQSVIGPHRDDLIFLINEKEAKPFASQGQQRSIVLAIKLAELKIIEKRKGEIPVLLLDDVFAELDESRQDFLLHNLPENIQIFLTTTHLSGIQKEFLKGAQILEIKNGQIVEADQCVSPR
jgi:DNA replication and repair protein RecF